MIVLVLLFLVVLVAELYRIVHVAHGIGVPETILLPRHLTRADAYGGPT